MKYSEGWELELLRALNEPLPLVERPFALVAGRVGVSEEEVLRQIKSWLADGTVRRFGARVSHQPLGYVANGMSVWDIPAGQVEEAAEYMTRQPEVSHCYLRVRLPSWPFNLYAMIHGETEEEVHAVAARIAEHAGLETYRLLFSSRELKKSVPRYFAEEESATGGLQV